MLRAWVGLYALLVAFFALTVLWSQLGAQEVPVPKVYKPFAFLIGEWSVSVAGAPPAAVSRFLWGPMKTFIRYSGAQLINGKEAPNWEGILVWNGVRHQLDMLLVLDLSTGDLAQEQGSVSVEADGSVVRDITVFYAEGNAIPPDWKRAAGPEGATARFRHTFRLVEPGRVSASVVRRTRDRWEPAFPGSDRLVMVRRSED